MWRDKERIKTVVDVNRAAPCMWRDEERVKTVVDVTKTCNFHDQIFVIGITYRL